MVTLIPLAQLYPHPQNPRLSARDDVVEQLAAQMATGFDPAHALLVRPIEGGYQIISGHHRVLAAHQAGISELPCWVRDLSDDEAYMQLVLCNTQSELHPLEEGKHAAESELSIRAYAEAVGKPHTTLADKIKAWRVLDCTHVRTDELRDSWRNLAEIHAAPNWLWLSLVGRMMAEGWTVAITREKVAKVKDLPKVLPDWIDARALGNNLTHNAVKVADVQRMLDLVEQSPLMGDYREGFRSALSLRAMDRLSDLQALHHEWVTAMETAAAQARAIEAERQKAAEAAAARVDRLRANCALTEWDGLSADERAELLTPEPYAATFNKQENADIEWAQWSWNPVTGCKHECSYCYARDIALSERMKSVYPNGFEPTFRSRSLNAPFRQKVPPEAATDTRYRNVFTCSMADLFGRWVPAEWVNAVLDSVRANPQWNFLFLTKFPKRMAEFDIPANAWMGTSVDLQVRVKAAEEAFEHVHSGVRWLSVEPMLEPLHFAHLDRFDWVVIGGASSSSKTPAWFPPVPWIFDLIAQCRAAGVKVYLKSNLFGASDKARAVNARILELPFDAPITQDPTLIVPESFQYLGRRSES